jgi:peptidoglycan hydrolase-like protein with peptidoglycan-binding domain
MKNINILESKNSLPISRFLTLSLVVVVAVFMFSLAYTASAATLVRQLEVGSRGQDVSDLQMFLAKDSSIYPQGLVTGYFGSMTKSAVINFQNRNGISAVGRVGPITLAAINFQMNGDNSSPSINSVNVTPGNNSATVSWNTNENSSAILYYSTSPLSMVEGSPTTGVTIGGSSVLAHANLQASHSVTLTSLGSNTTYYYVVYARDGSGNESITWPNTFKTN